MLCNNFIIIFLRIKSVQIFGIMKLNIRLPWQKKHSKTKRPFSPANSTLNLRKKLGKCYIWSTAFYGAENWTPRRVDHKYIEHFDMWYCSRVEKISWNDREKNEILRMVKEEKDNLHTGCST